MWVMFPPGTEIFLGKFPEKVDNFSFERGLSRGMAGGKGKIFVKIPQTRRGMISRRREILKVIRP